MTTHLETRNSISHEATADTLAGAAFRCLTWIPLYAVFALTILLGGAAVLAALPISAFVRFLGNRVATR